MSGTLWLKAVLCGAVAVAGGQAAYKAGQRDGARIEATRAKARPKPKPKPAPRPVAAAPAPIPPEVCIEQGSAEEAAITARLLPWQLPDQPAIAPPGGLIAPLVGAAMPPVSVRTAWPGGGWGWGGGAGGGSGGPGGGSTAPVPAPPPLLVGPGPGGPAGVEPGRPAQPPPPDLVALPPGPAPIPAPAAVGLFGLALGVLIAARRWRA
jgi:hypothetical protein